MSQEKEEKMEKTVPPYTEDALKSPKKQEEIGGPKGPEPTRYGDWERGGKCVDF